MSARKTDTNMIRGDLQDALGGWYGGFMPTDAQVVTRAQQKLARRGVSRETVQDVYDQHFKPLSAV